MSNSTSKDRFFFIGSIIYLFIAIGGFIPSFLLRPVFRDSNLPLFLIVHGTLLILWFMGYFHQNYLVIKGKIIDHKKNGRIWFLLIILMTLANLNLFITISGEVVNNEISYYDEIRTYENSGFLIGGGLLSVIGSTILVTIAYIKRNKPSIHKRALFIANVFYVVPAFDRLMRHVEFLPQFSFLFLSYLFPVLLMVHDYRKSKKVYRISIIGFLIYFGSLPVLLILAQFDIHIWVIDFLGGLYS